MFALAEWSGDFHATPWFLLLPVACDCYVTSAVKRWYVATQYRIIYIPVQNHMISATFANVCNLIVLFTHKNAVLARTKGPCEICQTI